MATAVINPAAAAAAEFNKAPNVDVSTVEVKTLVHDEPTRTIVVPGPVDEEFSTPPTAHAVPPVLVHDTPVLNVLEEGKTYGDFRDGKYQTFHRWKSGP